MQDTITLVQECFFDACDLQDWIEQGIAPSGYLTQQELLDNMKERLEEIETELKDILKETIK